MKRPKIILLKTQVPAFGLGVHAKNLCAPTPCNFLTPIHDEGSSAKRFHFPHTVTGVNDGGPALFLDPTQVLKGLAPRLGIHTHGGLIKD